MIFIYSLSYALPLLVNFVLQIYNLPYLVTLEGTIFRLKFEITTHHTHKERVNVYTSANTFFSIFDPFVTTLLLPFT